MKTERNLHYFSDHFLDKLKEHGFKDSHSPLSFESSNKETFKLVDVEIYNDRIIEYTLHISESGKMKSHSVKTPMEIISLLDKTQINFK